MLPVTPGARRAADWTRQTRMESLLLMELFLLLRLQFEESFSYTPAYCSDETLPPRVCRDSFKVVTSIGSVTIPKRLLYASCGSPSAGRVPEKL